MGMFDDISVKCQLPLPDDVKGYVTVQDFQTKSFDSVLDRYEIREDDTLWILNRKYDYNDETALTGKFPSLKLKLLSSEYVFCSTITNTIEVYTYEVTDGDYDYWVEYKLTIIDGLVTKKELVKFTANPNSTRKKRDDEFIITMRESAVLQKSRKYKYIYKPYNSVIKFIFRRLHRIVGLIYNGVSKLTCCLRRLERKLSI